MSVIFVLGGDGYCGWPLSLRLCSIGYKVIILDNLIRRRIDKSLNIHSLTPIKSIDERIYAAQKHGFDIDFINTDISINNNELRYVLGKYQPKCVINMAHQRSVPYSTFDYEKSSWTMQNTINGQFSLLEAIKDITPITKIIHLGSLGVFGYRDIGGAIPVKATHSKYILEDGSSYSTVSQIPFSPDSIYHLSKSINAQINEYYSRVCDLNIVDVYQATVWGCNADNYNDDRLVNRFDYDPIFGTVINRFCYQAFKNKKLSIYGSGNQERGFIHIEDSVSMIANIVNEDYFLSGQVIVKPLVNEICSINLIAETIANIYGVDIDHLANPRTERESKFSISSSELNGYSNSISDKTSIEKLVSLFKKYQYD